MNIRHLSPLFVLLVLVLCVNAAVVVAQDTTSLRKLNSEAAQLASKRKFKKAIKTAEQAVAEARKVFGDEHRETAITYLNLGEFQLARKKHSDAAMSFASSLNSIRPSIDQNKNLAWRIYRKLITAQTLSKQVEEAKASLAESGDFVVKSFGDKSEQNLAYATLTVNFLVLTKEKEKADQAFRNEYRATYEVLGADSEKLIEIMDRHYCFCMESFGNRAMERIIAFSQFVSELNRKSIAATGAKVVSSGVVNGRALSMPVPRPSRNSRRGLIAVRIVISKEGNVSSAKAICGHSSLRAVSESAARKARFAPTLLDGQPVEVSGIIVYRF